MVQNTFFFTCLFFLSVLGCRQLLFIILKLLFLLWIRWFLLHFCMWLAQWYHYLGTSGFLFLLLDNSIFLNSQISTVCSTNEDIMLFMTLVYKGFLEIIICSLHQRNKKTEVKIKMKDILVLEYFRITKE